MLMNFVEGNDLHKDSVFEKTLSNYVGNSPDYVRHKIILKDSGKLLVMDLLTRNNDRFLLDIDGLKNDDEIDDKYAWGGNRGNLKIDSEGHIIAKIINLYSPTMNRTI